MSESSARRRRSAPPKGGGHNECSISPGAAEVTATPCPVVGRGPVRRSPWSALLAACGSSTQLVEQHEPEREPQRDAFGGGAPGRRPTWRRSRPTRRSRPCCRAPSRAPTTCAVASDIPYPPWEYYVSATSKQATGFDYDLSQAIGKKIGIPTSFNETPFDSIILAIKGGKSDMIMSDMYDNADAPEAGRELRRLRATTARRSSCPRATRKGITNLDSLAGQTVACESGTTQQALLQTLNNQFKAAGKTTMTILALPNQPAALLAVTSGRAVGDLTDHSTAVVHRQDDQQRQHLQVVVDPASPAGLPARSSSASASWRATPQLISTVQKALQDLIDDGNYQKIVASYGLTPVTSAQVNQGAKPIPTTSISP